MAAGGFPEMPKDKQAHVEKRTRYLEAEAGCREWMAKVIMWAACSVLCGRELSSEVKKSLPKHYVPAKLMHETAPLCIDKDVRDGDISGYKAGPRQMIMPRHTCRAG